MIVSGAWLLVLTQVGRCDLHVFNLVVVGFYYMLVVIIYNLCFSLFLTILFACFVVVSG